MPCFFLLQPLIRHFKNLEMTIILHEIILYGWQRSLRISNTFAPEGNDLPYTLLFACGGGAGYKEACSCQHASPHAHVHTHRSHKTLSSSLSSSIPLFFLAFHRVSKQKFPRLLAILEPVPPCKAGVQGTGMNSRACPFTQVPRSQT